MNNIALAFAFLAAPIMMAQQPTAPAWVTVATFSLLNRTEFIITPAAIYAPTEPGLYRISYYVEAVAVSPAVPPDSYDYICPSIFWIDDSGSTQSRIPPNGVWATASSYGGSNPFGGTSDVF